MSFKLPEPGKEPVIPADYFDTAWQRTTLENSNNFQQDSVYGVKSSLDKVFHDVVLEQQKLINMEKKAEIQETERERRKSQMDILNISEEGAIIVSTSNTRLQHAPRLAGNFKNPKMRLYNCVGQERQIIELSFEIGNSEKNFWISEEMLGSESELIKKFNSSGAYFLAKKSERKKDYAIQLITTLMRTNPEQIEIAEKTGWYVNGAGKICFAKEGDITWEKLMKKI